MTNRLTSNKCRFCREFLVEGSTDDINNRICARCWREIDKVFIIAEIKSAERQQNEANSS